MATNAFFLTTMVLMAGGIVLLETCQFLVPYRDLLVRRYGFVILVFAAALFVNGFALFYTASRWLLLKDTGRKLAHLEKELHTGTAISEELATRLQEDDHVS